MIYHKLDADAVIAYIRNTPTLHGYFENNDVIVQEIGDGNLNFIFLITSCLKPQQQLIIKQSIPYLRCVGEDFPLAKERIHYEIAAFRHYLQHTPQHIPMVYHVDETMCLFAMHYCGSHQIMRQGMIEGMIYPQFAEHMSTFLAENLFKTSSLYLSNIEKSQLVAQFNSNELQQLTANFVFTFPYMDHPTNHIGPGMQDRAKQLWRDFAFKSQMLVLKDLFMNKMEALLHGDLHTGSILINEEETIVIDPEFACMGPFGFDLGAILANLIMSWISHVVIHPAENRYATWILTVIHELMARFEQKFLALWNQSRDNALLPQDFFLESEMERYQRQFMLTILQETIGFAGCKIARRQWGVAGVQDIRGIQEEALRMRAEMMAISIARAFVVNYRHYHRIHDIFNVLEQHRTYDSISMVQS